MRKRPDLIPPKVRDQADATRVSGWLRVFFDWEAENDLKHPTIKHDGSRVPTEEKSRHFDQIRSVIETALEDANFKLIERIRYETVRHNNLVGDGFPEGLQERFDIYARWWANDD